LENIIPTSTTQQIHTE